MEKLHFNVELSLEEAKLMNGSLLKHDSAVVIENVQKQILAQLATNSTQWELFDSKSGQGLLAL